MKNLLLLLPLLLFASNSFAASICMVTTDGGNSSGLTIYTTCDGRQAASVKVNGSRDYEQGITGVIKPLLDKGYRLVSISNGRNPTYTLVSE